MTIEEKLKELIIQEYKSLRNFAPYTGLPYSTIVAILKRGVMNSSAQNVFKICSVLGISVDALRDNEIVKVERQDLKAEHLKPKEVSRHLHAYAERLGIDNKPLSPDETEFLEEGVNIIVEQIRKKREKDK